MAEIRPENIQREWSLVVGDLALSKSEDALSWQWPDCLERKPRAFRVITAIWRIVEQVARDADADQVLLEIGPNLGAINRAALIAADHVVVPLAPTLHSLHGLKKLGPSLRR